MGDSSSSSWFQRHQFLIRRLHSLSGIVPVGVFLVIHLTINSTILAGGEAFQTAVDGIHLLEKVGLLVAAEVFGIFLPILFHGVVGILILRESTPTASHYRYGGNLRYTLQRVTGVVAFIFIFYHLWQMHWLGEKLGGAQFDGHAAPASAAAAIQSAWFHAPLYAVGVVATVFHFANGIWTSLITWGITIGPRSQRVAGWVCAGFGIVLGLMGLGSLSTFRTFDQAAHSPPAEVAAHVDQSPSSTVDEHR